MTTKRGRGERAGLTRDAILSTALRLADTEGPQALSMRRLAKELGVEAMTLYHHVANKEQLLDGVVEQVIAEVDVEGDGEDWQTALRRSAVSLRDALERHPKTMPLVLSRPAATTRNLDVVERMLARLTEAGFSLERAADVLYSTIGQVVSYCARTAQQPTELAALESLDAQRYPLLSASQGNVAGDSAARFDFTLSAMITGFAVSLDSSR